MGSRPLSLLFASLLLSLLAGVSGAGVRVTEPRSVAAADVQPGVPLHSNLQLAAGPAVFASGPAGPDGTTRSSWGATAALEIVHSAGVSWILRGEYARDEKESTIGIGRAADLEPPSLALTTRTADSFGSLETGARVTATKGTARPYLELTAGLGLRDQQSGSGASYAPGFVQAYEGRSLVAACGVAVGEAWQPARVPFGLFGELRTSVVVGRGGAAWLTPRAGLLVHR